MPLFLMLTFTGEGPNACGCGAEVPGTNHWHGVDEIEMPWWTCESCGLHLVVNGGEIAIYGSEVLL